MPAEKEKMLAGELYNAVDPQLAMERRRARRLVKEYNSTDDEEQEHRQPLLATMFDSMGSNIVIEPPFICDYGSNIYLGGDVFINFNCAILDCALVEIGSTVLFEPTVQIYAGTHPLDYQTRCTCLELTKPIRMGSDVWVSGGAIIGPGITICDRAVIGAGSMVARSIAADVFATGNPCRVIRELEAQ